MSTLCGVVVLEVGGPLLGAIRGPPAQTPGDVMKTTIKIVKRDDRNVTPDKEIAARTNRQRDTALIVKSWIIESRERRRAALNLLRKVVRG